MKLEEASERVKVMVAVSPTPRESSPSSSVMAMLGRMVSTVRVRDCHVVTLSASTARSLAVFPVVLTDPMT